MFRTLAIGIIIGAALGSQSPALGQEDPEAVLAAKDLRRSGSMFVLKTEDEAKAAADVAAMRLREYRLAASREKASAMAASERKALLANLTRQRAALRQRYDRMMPALRAQMQELRAQQAALRQQIGPMRDAAIYTANNFARVQNNQLVDQHNAMTDQIDMLQEQANQLTLELNELNERIEWLGDEPGKSETAASPGGSADTKRDAYIEALHEQRKVFDEVKRRYAALADDAEARAALESLSGRTAKIKYTLGPSKKFQESVKALEQAEQQVTSGALDASPAGPPAKRKARAARKK